MSEQAVALPQIDTQLTVRAELVEAPHEGGVALIDTAQLKKTLEAALLTTQEPLLLAELKKLSDAPVENRLIEELLEQLAQEYSSIGTEKVSQEAPSRSGS